MLASLQSDDSQGQVSGVALELRRETKLSSNGERVARSSLCLAKKSPPAKSFDSFSTPSSSPVRALHNDPVRRGRIEVSRRNRR